MSDEIIDLAKVERAASLLPAHWTQRKHTLALVATVRAARRLVCSSMDDVQTCQYFDDLDASLSRFTDSAEPAA